MKGSTMKNRLIPRRLRAFLADRDGSIGIVIALLLPVLFGFAGLAVDIGHSYAVKSQLKNAADAGALRGARALVPYTASATPNWASALVYAPLAVGLNRADNKQLTDCDVTYGYWSFTTNPPSLRSAGIVPGASDFPAVSVTVSKTAGKNDGPISIYLASILGLLSADVGATSVAIISFPTGMPPGALKPMVATTDIVTKYWDRSDPNNPGQPFQFKLGDGTQAEDTMWSTFKVDNNSNDYTKELILTGNPTDVYIGDGVYLQPGVRAVDYGPNEMGKFINQTVVLPVVAPDTLTEKTFAPILDFIAFHITGFSQGGKYVEGYFDKNYVITNPQAGKGVPTNTYSTSNSPQLVN
jgi:Putative Flp pilus-assembly TadE/G-like